MGMDFGSIVAGLPLAGAIAWFLMPGHVAMPFYFDMSLSYIADFIAGGVCVPLGMIIGLRPARWYVSRGFPLAMMWIARSLEWLDQKHADESVSSHVKCCLPRRTPTLRRS